jgi:hypothetical protein
MVEPEILDYAVQVIDNSSGGMKFMELLPSIWTHIPKTMPQSKQAWLGRNTTPDELLEAIKADPRFKIFEYYWKMDDTLRVKYFVSLTYSSKGCQDAEDKDA